MNNETVSAEVIISEYQDRLAKALRLLNAESQIEAEINLQEMISKVSELMRERCAVAAWSYFADTCKSRGLNPHSFGEWISSQHIRSIPNITLDDLRNSC